MEPKIQLLRNSWMTLATAFAVVVALTLPGRAGADISSPDLGTFAISNTSWTPVNFGGYAPVQNTYTLLSGVFTDTYSFGVISSSQFQFMRLDDGGTRGITNISWTVYDSSHDAVYSGSSAAGLLASNSQSALENAGSYTVVISGTANGPGIASCTWPVLTGCSQGAMYFGTLQLAPPLTTPVPEPETYAMMLAGLGLMGLVARRRKQKENA